jgi:hypothetical protein
LGSIVPANPRSLWRLIGAEAEDLTLWAREDFGDILAHQLRAPLLFDLAKVTPIGGIDAELFQRDRIGTFRELLTHPKPPVELLALCKDFAKAARVDPDRPLPAEVATVLYLASIAAARLRHDARISNLRVAELRSGAVWVLSQNWVDAEIQAIFHELLKVLDDATA